MSGVVWQMNVRDYRDIHSAFNGVFYTDEVRVGDGLKIKEIIQVNVIIDIP